MKRVEIIAGRPNSGKTLAAIHLCRQCVLKKKSVLYFAIELSEKYLVENFNIPRHVKVIDDPRLELSDIAKLIEKIRPHVTVIDYLQLIHQYNENIVNDL